MENSCEYRDVFQIYLSKLQTEFDGIDKDYPFAKYQLLLTQSPKYSSYQCVSGQVSEFCHFLDNDYSPDATAHYHRCLLLYLIANASQVHDSKIYPSRVEDAFLTEYQRIVEDAAINPAGFYNYDNDLFCKDLAVCTHKMFPIGAFKAEVTGIPRRIIFKDGWRQFVRLLRKFAKLGSNKPFYEIHLDIRYRSTFSPQGWDDCFHMLAEMLEKNPDIMGFTGSSWFFDPQISVVSPNLGYLRKLIEENGGEFYYYKENEHTTELALESSSTRRKYYDQGAYRPASYLAIWPRAELMEWAKKQKELAL